MDADKFRNRNRKLINDFITEHFDELIGAKNKGIAQGWEECRQAQRTQIPNVVRELEKLIKIADGDISQAEKAIKDYNESTALKCSYSETDIEEIMKQSFMEGERNQRYMNKEHRPYDNAYDFSQKYLDNIHKTGRVDSTLSFYGEDCVAGGEGEGEVNDDYNYDELPHISIVGVFQGSNETNGV